MRDRPGRWSRVKIVLFYTGTAEPGLEPHAFVLKPDGTTRPLGLDERGEGFRRRAPAREAARPPLPQPLETRSPLASAVAAIKRMFVSHPYGNTDPKVDDSDDLALRERQAVLDFIADASIPAARKRIVLTRYSIDDQEMGRALIAAVKAGARVDLVTDFNTSMEFKLGEGEEIITDFSRAKLKSDEAGAFIKLLLDNGFKIVGNGSTEDPRGAIYSQPL